MYNVQRASCNMHAFMCIRQALPDALLPEPQVCIRLRCVLQGEIFPGKWAGGFTWCHQVTWPTELVITSFDSDSPDPTQMTEVNAAFSRIKMRRLLPSFGGGTDCLTSGQ